MTLLQAGGKVVDGVAAEAVNRQSLGMYLVWEVGCLVSATAQGYAGRDHAGAAMFLLDLVDSQGYAEIVTTGSLYLHQTGPGSPAVLAEMKSPVIVMQTGFALDFVDPEDRSRHWLNSPFERNGAAGPLHEALPYLIVGAGPWQTLPSKLPTVSLQKYARAGSAGALWWIFLDHVLLTTHP